MCGFAGYYYKLSSQKELDEFLDHPEKYVPPLSPNKLPPPELRPKRLTGDEARAMFPQPIELQGYCPVTYLDGKCRYVNDDDSLNILEYHLHIFLIQIESALGFEI